jgi:hypothetical protein
MYEVDPVPVLIYNLVLLFAAISFLLPIFKRIGGRKSNTLFFCLPGIIILPFFLYGLYSKVGTDIVVNYSLHDSQLAFYLVIKTFVNLVSLVTIFFLLRKEESVILGGVSDAEVALINKMEDVDTSKTLMLLTAFVLTIFFDQGLLLLAGLIFLFFTDRSQKEITLKYYLSPYIILVFGLAFQMLTAYYLSPDFKDSLMCQSVCNIL